MKPEDQAAILRELGKISGQQAATEARHEERDKAMNARVTRLETKVEASGQHDITDLERSLATALGESRKMKWWLLGIVGSLITTGIGAFVAYLVTR